MKRILLLAAMLLMAGMVNAKVVEKTYTVRGHCNMCKNRIENTAICTDGVKEAEYDLQAQSLRLVYDSGKTSPKKVLKRIAAIGYDADRFKAPQEVYDALEPCCHYREIEGVNEHDHAHGEGHHHAE